jgi:hypothetical protein
MTLSICLFVFLSSWKAANAFLPLQARAFTLATNKPTTSSSLNADAEHDNVSDFRKGQRIGSPGSIEVRTCILYFFVYPYCTRYLYDFVVFFHNYLTILSHFLHSIEH